VALGKINKAAGKETGTERARATSEQSPGNPRHLIALVEDTTQRKDLERFELTFNHAAVGMSQMSLDGRLMQVNQKYADMLGYTREELRGVSTETLTHTYDIAATRQARRRLVEGRARSVADEKRLIRKDGRVIWVRRSASVARGSADEPLYFISTVEDISEYKSVEEELIRERALLRAIIDTLPDYIYVKDAEGRFSLANKAWLRERGIGYKDIAGKTVFDVFPN
jgi:PAS domain S-box-containing protein